MHLERNTLNYVIEEIKDGKLFKFWLNNNSQKYIEYTKDCFEKYLKDISINYKSELGKTVYLVGDLNVLDNQKNIFLNNFSDAEIVKVEYLDWIVKGIKLGKEKDVTDVLFL